MLDSPQIRSALRKAAAALLGMMLALVLMTVLLLAGFYLLLQAALLVLAPWTGEAGALALTGGVCLSLVALVFYRLTRPASALAKDEDDSPARSPVRMLGDLIRQNPLESASVAFALGFAEQSDPQLRALLLRGGMELMRETESPSADEATPTPSPDDPPA